MNLESIGVIVTGGASGLGSATAALLASKGARVTIVDVSADAGAAAAAAIGGVFVAADVTDEASVGAALDAAETAHGISRILVNCAGVAPAIKTVSKDGQAHPLEAFRRAVGINLVGTFTSSHSLPHVCRPPTPSARNVG
jgi:NAD(P)-dependent dehydrogenase (short-subunit alcohol dehydrogenase family)